MCGVGGRKSDSKAISGQTDRAEGYQSKSVFQLIVKLPKIGCKDSMVQHKIAVFNIASTQLEKQETKTNIYWQKGEV